VGDSFGGVGLCVMGHVFDQVIQAQEQVNVVMLVAFVLGCVKTSHVFEITGFYFFINF
jgi:hypothetical protein